MVVFKSPDKKHTFSIDKNIVRVLQRAHHKTHHEDSEVWIAVFGDTGSGKSLFTQQCSYAKEKKLIPLSDILFDKRETINRIISCENKTDLIIDEAISSFFNRENMTKEGRLIGELTCQVRQKNLTIWLCVPDLLTLDSMVLNKIKVAIEVKEARKKIRGETYTTKGNAKFYVDFPGKGGYQVRRLVHALRIKKRNPINKVNFPKPAFIHAGNPVGKNYKSPWYPVVEGEKAYRAKKESVLEKYELAEEKPKKTETQIKMEVLRRYKELTGASYRAIAADFGIPYSTIRDNFVKGGITEGQTGAVPLPNGSKQCLKPLSKNVVGDEINAKFEKKRTAKEVIS